MSELGGKMPCVKKYLRLKEQMDALRNERHADIDNLAQNWRKLLTGDKEANKRLMDLTHDSTIDGQDPSKPYMPVSEERDPYIVTKYGLNTKTGRDAQDRMDKDAANRAAYDALRKRFMKLPAEFRDMFVDVRDAYSELADEFESAIEANAEKAMTVAVRRAERAHDRRLEEIRDEGLTGKEKDEAIEQADAELKTAKMQNRWAKNARFASLRQRFESNRLDGPYFPLARFGDFYVTLRDKEGAVVSFSRFEKARDQRKFAEEKRSGGFDVEIELADGARTVIFHCPADLTLGKVYEMWAPATCFEDSDGNQIAEIAAGDWPFTVEQDLYSVLFEPADYYDLSKVFPAYETGTDAYSAVVAFQLLDRPDTTSAQVIGATGATMPEADIDDNG